jgi:hypothetical protein
MPRCATTSDENPRNLRSISVISVTIFRTANNSFFSLNSDIILGAKAPFVKHQSPPKKG